MRTIRIIILAITVVAWVVAIGSGITAVTDVSTFPEPLRGFFGLWPEPDSATAIPVRFGAVAVLIAGILTFRATGKALKRQEQEHEAASRPVVSGG